MENKLLFPLGFERNVLTASSGLETDSLRQRMRTHCVSKTGFQEVPNRLHNLDNTYNKHDQVVIRLYDK